jgi:hypothetical protein
VERVGSRSRAAGGAQQGYRLVLNLLRAAKQRFIAPGT